MRRLVPPALVALIALSSGCTDHDTRPQERLDLVDHRQWTQLDGDADPFDDRPSEVDCDSLAWGYELFSGEDSLGMDAEFCNYLTVSQPLLYEVRATDRMGLRIWHFELIGEGEAHLLVSIDGHVLHDERLPIPSPSGISLIDDELAGFDAPAGAEVLFHVHNHGANSYSLLEISATPEGAPEA